MRPPPAAPPPSPRRPRTSAPSSARWRTPIGSECVCVCARTRREWGRTGTQSSAGIHLLARGVVARHAFHPKEPPAFVWKRRHLRMRTQRCTHDTRGADPPQPARVRAYVCLGLRDNVHPRERAAAPPAGTAGTGTHCACAVVSFRKTQLCFCFCEHLTNNKSAVFCRFSSLRAPREGPKAATGGDGGGQGAGRARDRFWNVRGGRAPRDWSSLRASVRR